VVYAEARAAVRPDDPNGRVLAAEAHLQAAYRRTVTQNAAVFGGAGGWAARVERVEDGPDVRAAVAHLRAARRASPVAARAHARLGLLAGHFTGEPARVHFDRAKRLLPADPEVWYAAGREALARGDKAAALADWQRSLALGVGRLADMLVAVRGMPVDELRTRLLPAEPTVSQAAADALFPDRLRQAEQRRPFLAAAVAQVRDKANATGADWHAAARAADELGRREEASEFWKSAAANAPKSAAVREGYASFLEREELYEEAVDQLRQLQKLNDSPVVLDRIEANYHAMKLKRAIGE
jgi:tetratricopeptide (TPR) repeat protein